MSHATNIPYADVSWNIVDGCLEAGEGCRHCWASRWAHRMAGMGQQRMADLTTAAGHWTGVVRTRDDLLRKPHRWRRPRRVFVCSMADLFHSAVPDDFLHRAFDVMEQCADAHTFLIFTKRWRRMREYLSWRWGEGRIPCRGIWPIVSAWDQVSYNAAVQELSRTPAHVRGVSLEPLLGPVDLRLLDLATGNVCIHPLHWLISGGESGPHFRPDREDWHLSLMDQCHSAGVAYYFKQRAGLSPGYRGFNPELLSCKQLPVASGLLGG